MQIEFFRGELVAGTATQEDAQRLPQPRVVLVVGREVCRAPWPPRRGCRQRHHQQRHDGQTRVRRRNHHAVHACRSSRRGVHFRPRGVTDEIPRRHTASSRSPRSANPSGHRRTREPSLGSSSDPETAASPTRSSGRQRRKAARRRVGGFTRIAKKSLQPTKLVAVGAGVRVPHDERQVVPPQWVSDRRGRRVDVDGLAAVKQLPNPQGAQAVLVLQPPFALVFVDDDDLLRNPVDVLEHGAGNRLDDRVPRLLRHVDRRTSRIPTRSSTSDQAGRPGPER